MLESISLSYSPSTTQRLIHSSTILDAEAECGALCNRKLVIFINSKLRTPWTILQIFIIIYYLCSIPLRFPLMVDGISPINGSLSMDYICDFLLFIDLILNLFYFHIIKTTQIGHDDYIREPRKIYSYYTKCSQFKYDILSLLPFELFILCLNTSTYFILFRLNKLSRLTHLRSYLSAIETFCNKKIFATSLQSASYRLIYLILTFVLTVHWFACIWFTLGEYELTQHNNGWMFYDTPIPQTFSRKYARSYYWATITLVTTGYGDIHPKTRMETFFLLFVMMVAVSLCTAIIASFASIFANGNILQWEHEQRMEVIQQYMQWKHLPDQIQQTVGDYFHYLWTTNDGIQEKTILNKIPWHLRKDIMIFMEGEALNRCSLFRTMDDNFIASLSVLLTPVLLSPGHYVYQKGQSADSMWLLYRGKCEMLNEKGRAIQVLEDNSFFGEAALLNHAKREESVRTITFTHLYVLRKDEFQSLLRVMTNIEATNENTAIEEEQKEEQPEIKIRNSLMRDDNIMRQHATTFLEKSEQLDSSLGNDKQCSEQQIELTTLESDGVSDDEDDGLGTSSSSEYDRILSEMKKSYEASLKMKTKVNKFFGSMDEAPPQKPRGAKHCKCIDLKKMFDPKSRFMKLWNSLHFLIVFYSFMAYPYRSAFSIATYRDWSVQNHAFVSWLALDVAIDCFWFLDFYLRCQHFGYHVTRGSLKYVVYNPSEIWLKYKTSTQFKYDLFCILPIEYVLCFSTIVPMDFFSIIRCKILIKWWCYLDEWTKFLIYQFEDILSLNAMRLVMLFLKIVLFGHILSCIWYFIGFLSNESMESEREYSELKVWFDYDELHFSTQFRRYIRSLYWSFITITTTGYGDIRAYTVLESWYAGSCVFLGGMVYYGAVGQISSLITKMSWMERNFFQRKDDLETFMKIKQLPQKITQRVRDYYSYMWDRQRGFEESAILNEFPRSLQSEVTKALNEKIVSCIPLFADCDESVIKEVTSNLEYRVHLPHDNIVSPNEMATEMFIVNRGWAEILDENHQSLGLLSEGCWYGHTDFITQERRQCYIKALTFCDISVLSVDDLCAVMTLFPSSEKTILNNVRRQRTNYLIKMDAVNKNLECEKIADGYLGDRKRNESLFVSATSKSKNIIHPNSHYRTIWTGIILVLMLFNTIEIPLFIAFVPSDLNDSHFIITLILHIFVDMIGCINIWFHFYRFGFEEEGQIIVDPDLIKDKFWNDRHNKWHLIAFAPIDYCLIFVFALLGYPSLQCIAFVRCLRLISLSQFFEYTNWLQIKIQESKRLSISTNLFYFVQLFVLLTLIAHWCGLLFFILSKLVDDADAFNGYSESWITRDLNGELYAHSAFVQYLRSFYWALSTMTVVCFGDVTPQKDASTIYVTIVVIMCFFIVGNIIGNIGDLLGRIDAASAELKSRSDQFDVFAASHNLPDFLVERVKLYLNELYQAKKGINTAKIMADFPPALKNQVMMHLFTPLLLNTPYFEFIEHNLIEKLSQYLQYELYVEHDFLCVYDEPADRIQILETGKVKILDKNNFLIATLDRAGDIIGDISFFLNANRKSASIQAATFVECVSLNKDRFRKVFISCPAYLEQMKRIALEKKKRIIEINSAVHNNLKRLVRKQRLHRFADLSDALPPDIREHLINIESRNVEKIQDSLQAYSRRSKYALAKSGPHVLGDSEFSLSSKSCSNLSRSSTRDRVSATDILSSIFSEQEEDENNKKQNEENTKHSVFYSMNAYRGWDGFVGIIILMQSMLIWFRLCFFYGYRTDEHFINSFIFISLIIEYAAEIIFYFDVFCVKFKILPNKILECQHILYRQSLSFWCDAFCCIPFEILLFIPYICGYDCNIMHWMIWLRAPKLLRLRSFDNNKYEEETDKHIYKSSLNQRLTNLEKFISANFAISLFSWRYVSFCCCYLMGAHYMGGLWYLCGVLGSAYYPNTWMKRDQTVIFVDGHNNGVVDLYVRSLYFCLNAMTTTGYGDIAATNPLETVFMLVLIIVSVIMFASMVGLFQSATMSQDTHLARFQLQIESTKSFMKRHQISPALKERSLCHFQYVWNRSRGVDESNVLGSLPSSLKGDIVLFMNKNLFQNVRWFKNCSRGFVRSIATRLEQHLFLSNEVIFQSGHMGQHMFFINEGVIQIIIDDGDQSVTLKSGDFFGHKAVIHSTPRTYTAIAQSACELLSLSVAKFEELLDYEPNLPQMLAEQDIVDHIISPFSKKVKSGSNSRTPTKSDYVSIEMSSMDSERKQFLKKRSASDSNIANTEAYLRSSRSKRGSSSLLPNKRHSCDFLGLPHKIQERHSMYDIAIGSQRNSSAASIMTNSSFDVIDSFRRKLKRNSSTTSSKVKKMIDAQIDMKKTL